MGNRKIPLRFWMAVMFFITSYVSYTTTGNMLVSITYMVDDTQENITVSLLNEEHLDNNDTEQIIAGNQTNVNATKNGPPFKWSTDTQQLILDSYFWGYLIGNIPSGFIVEWYGPYSTILYSSIVSAFFNSLCVRAGEWHYFALMACRFVLGVLSATVFPSLQCLIARWSLPSETGRFVSTLTGSSLGILVSWVMVDVVSRLCGWDWGIHFLSIQIAVFCLLFGVVASDSPEEHKWISYEEKRRLREALDDRICLDKVVPPYSKILTSKPFWDLCLAHFADMWSLYFQITCLPSYLMDEFEFDLKTATIISALPQIFKMLFGFGFGSIDDLIRFKKLLSENTRRKLFTIFSHLIPGILLMFVMITQSNSIRIILIVVISTAFSGATVATNFKNPQELSPNLSGTIVGIMNLIGGSAAIAVPLINRALTAKNFAVVNFPIVGGIYVICGLIFIVGGSSDIQLWNEKIVKRSEDEQAFSGSNSAQVHDASNDQEVTERSPLNT